MEKIKLQLNSSAFPLYFKYAVIVREEDVVKTKVLVIKQDNKTETIHIHPYYKPI